MLRVGTELLQLLVIIPTPSRVKIAKLVDIAIHNNRFSVPVIGWTKMSHLSLLSCDSLVIRLSVSFKYANVYRNLYELAKLSMTAISSSGCKVREVGRISISCCESKFTRGICRIVNTASSFLEFQECDVLIL